MATIIRQRGVSTRSFPGKREFVAKVRECLALARQVYGSRGFTLEDKDLPIVFFEKGTTAGWAKWKRVGGRFHYNLEFNISAIEENREDMMQDTIPHEVAHIVDHFLYGRSSGHGRIWKNMCITLGGSGRTTHSYKVKRARRSSRFVYIADCGTQTEVGPTVHKRIQRGMVYTLRRTGGKLKPEGFIRQEVKA